MMLVADANVWIHLHDGGVVAEAFRLPYRFASPDVVLDELRPDPQLVAELLELGLVILRTDERQERLLEALRSRFVAPGEADLYALLQAQVCGATLATGNKHLRRAAEHEGVPAVGVLWLLNEMVSGRILAPPRAADALEAMLARGAWLPRAECEARVRRWRADGGTRRGP